MKPLREFVDVFPEMVVLKRKEMIADLPWREMYHWCAEQGIVIKFTNHWSDKSGENYSFEVPGTEEQRAWFILRYA